MNNHFSSKKNTTYDFLIYLAKNYQVNERIPALNVLSKEIGLSTSSLREQMEVARALGIIDVRPRTGIRKLAYSFRAPVYQSLSYAIEENRDIFAAFADLRFHLEVTYWFEAVSLLTNDDKEQLQDLVKTARMKIMRIPVQNPFQEHRNFHLLIYKHIHNPFLTGILESYWELYEKAGLDVYSSTGYLSKVWDYHHEIVECIVKGEYQTGLIALKEHFNLFTNRKKMVEHQKFE